MSTHRLLLLSTSLTISCSNSNGTTCLDDQDWGHAVQCTAWRINTEATSTHITGALTAIDRRCGDEAMSLYASKPKAFLPTATPFKKQTYSLSNRPKADEDFVNGMPK